MRKKVKIIGMLVFISAICINIHTSKQYKSSVITLTSLIKVAQAGTEGCLITPGDLRGKCRKNVSGEEWNCVEGWPKDCTAD